MHQHVRGEQPAQLDALPLVEDHALRLDPLLHENLQHLALGHEAQAPLGVRVEHVDAHLSHQVITQAALLPARRRELHDGHVAPALRKLGTALHFGRKLAQAVLESDCPQRRRQRRQQQDARRNTEPVQG